MKMYLDLFIVLSLIRNAQTVDLRSSGDEITTTFVPPLRNRTNASSILAATQPRNDQLEKSNCTMNKDDGVISYKVNETYAPSHCVHCYCHSNSTSSCFETDHQNKTSVLCSNCKDVPRIQCKYCVALDKTTKVNFTGWRTSEFECMECDCLHGRIHCSYPIELTLSIQLNSYITLLSKKLCIGDDCNRHVDNIRTNEIRYTCKVCQDGNTTYYNSMWMKKVDSIPISCSCTDEGILCNSYSYIEGVRFVISCKNCTNERAVQTFTKKGCKFQGLAFDNGDFKFVSVSGVMICLQCACYLGNIRCVFPHGENNEHCIGAENCSKVANRADVIDKCRNKAQLKCPPQILSWESDGCHYTCVGGKLSIVYKYIPWCQKLAKNEGFCVKCSDKNTFISNNNDTIFQCTTGEVIWNDHVCDGRNDCSNGTDEENCTTYQCNMDMSNGMEWKATRINDTVFKDCHSRNNALEGFASRTCLMKEDKGSYWNDVNFCNCVNKEQNKKISKIFEAIGETSLKALADDMASLYNFTEDAVVHIEIMNASIQILQTAVRLHSNITNQSAVVNDVNQMLELLENEKTIYNCKMKLSFLCPDSPQNQSSTFTCRTEGFNIYYSETLCWNDETKSYKSQLHKNLKTVFILYSVLPSNAYKNIKKGYTTLVKILDPMSEILLQVKMRRSQYGINVSTDDLEVLISKRIIENYHRDNITMIENVLSVVSIVALIIALLLYRILKIRNTTKVIIHKNLSTVFLMNEIIQKVPVWAFDNLHDGSKKICVIILVLIYYTTLAVFSWMMVEGINLAMVVIMVFERRNKRVSELTTLGYGIPLFCTCFMMICSMPSFSDTENCLTLSGNLWILKGPMAMILAVNVILFVIILSSICKRKKVIASTKSNSRTGISLKAFFVLIPLLGLPFIIGLFIEYSPIYLGYVYVCCNGLMGMFLLVLHCLLDPKIQSSFQRRWSRQTVRSSSNKEYSTNSPR